MEVGRSCKLDDGKQNDEESYSVQGGNSQEEFWVQAIKKVAEKRDITWNGVRDAVHDRIDWRDNGEKKNGIDGHTVFVLRF